MKQRQTSEASIGESEFAAHRAIVALASNHEITAVLQLPEQPSGEAMELLTPRS
jgi:hypothetical protein